MSTLADDNLPVDVVTAVVTVHAILHAEVFLRELLANPPETHLSDRDHARAEGHADELAHALRLISGGMETGSNATPIITRADVDRFTFREYRKTVLTKISDEVLPPGTRVGTLEGECVGSEPSRLAIDAAGNVYLVEERMFARSYIVVGSYVENASSPPSTPS